MMSAEERSYRDSKRKLPQGWRWVQLEKVGRFESGGTPSKENLEYWGGDIPFVTGADITELNISAKHARAFLTQAGLTSGKTAICSPQTVLFVTRTRVGRVGMAIETMGASQDLSPYICGPELLPEYACRYLLSISDYLAVNCRGATIQGVTRDFVHALEIPLPPLHEQKHIAAILSEQLTAVEQARVATKAQLKAASELPAAYLREVFSSPEAQKWPRKRLGESCLLLPSKSIATNGDTNVRAITTACLTEMGFDPSGVKHARMWAKDAAECVVSSGEILIARSNTPELVGRVAMFTGSPEKAVASDLTIRIWPRDGILSPFLTGYLASLYMDGYWRDRAGGASGSMKKITRTQIESELIPIPPLAEQQHVAAVLNERLASTNRLCQSLEKQLAAINTLPATLLREAFAGRL